MEEVRAAHDKLLAEFNEYQEAVNKTTKYNARIVRETAKLDELETPENAPILQILRLLLLVTDTLVEQETMFKSNCKRQMEELKTKIKALEAGGCVSCPFLLSPSCLNPLFLFTVMTTRRRQSGLTRFRRNTSLTRRGSRRRRSSYPRRKG